MTLDLETSSELVTPKCILFMASSSDKLFLSCNLFTALKKKSYMYLLSKYAKKKVRFFPFNNNYCRIQSSIIMWYITEHIICTGTSIDRYCLYWGLNLRIQIKHSTWAKGLIQSPELLPTENCLVRNFTKYLHHHPFLKLKLSLHFSLQWILKHLTYVPPVRNYSIHPPWYLHGILKWGFI